MDILNFNVTSVVFVILKTVSSHNKGGGSIKGMKRQQGI